MVIPFLRLEPKATLPATSHHAIETLTNGLCGVFELIPILDIHNNITFQWVMWGGFLLHFAFLDSSHYKMRINMKKYRAIA